MTLGVKCTNRVVANTQITAHLLMFLACNVATGRKNLYVELYHVFRFLDLEMTQPLTHANVALDPLLLCSPIWQTFKLFLFRLPCSTYFTFLE